MLLQSHEGFIRLLPALPEDWPEGSVSGLRAAGGYTFDIAWQGGQLTRAVGTASHAGVLFLWDGRTYTHEAGEQIIIA